MSWSDAELDDRIEEIIVDAYADDEQLCAFACVLDEPAGASAIGQAVELTAVEDGGARVGLRATVGALPAGGRSRSSTSPSSRSHTPRWR